MRLRIQTHRATVELDCNKCKMEFDIYAGPAVHQEAYTLKLCQDHQKALLPRKLQLPAHQPERRPQQ
jgi:hypothetical protein